MRDAISEAIALLLASVIAIAIGGAFLMFGYGVILLVFRHAFGIELPNPVDWLPPGWAQRLHLR